MKKIVYLCAKNKIIEMQYCLCLDPYDYGFGKKKDKSYINCEYPGEVYIDKFIN